MLQELWKKKIAWDAELPPAFSKKNEKWRKQLNLLKETANPRCLIENPDDACNLSLHTFCELVK